AVVMLENYRDFGGNKNPDEIFFASDAFLSQWMRAMGTTELRKLPEKFPAIVYRNHIENKETLGALLAVSDAEHVHVAVGSIAWNQLSTTPNFKTTLSMMNDFNAINHDRRLPKIKVLGVDIYKGPTLKFTFENDDAEVARNSP
ncbi:hypothetical protein, partial [Trinickia sp.]|uniref:hypothetical protein n=1 Tax=Trinickia sp. TaxID=2571163 RepID=UPI003F80EFD9